MNMTMEYTGRQIGCYAHANDDKKYTVHGELHISGVFQRPAYSGNFVREVTFVPFDRRLPCAHVKFEAAT